MQKINRTHKTKEFHWIFIIFGILVGEAFGGDEQLFEDTETDACDLDSISQYTINDTDINYEIYRGTYNGDTVTFTIAPNGYIDNDIAIKYFTVTSANGYLSLITSESFENVNADANYTAGDNLYIYLSMTLVCPNNPDTGITFALTIVNTNQNAPEFEKVNYNYKVPVPIMPKVDFSTYGDVISASDIDFSTTAIEFSIDPDDFDIKSMNFSVSKTFTASFTAKRVITFTEPQVYILTATDSGSPSKTTSVNIILETDSNTALDTPTFSTSIYTFNYTKNADDKGELTPTGSQSDIQVLSNKQNNAQYSLDGENAEYFELSFDNNTKIFTIAMNPQNETVPMNSPSPLSLILTYETDFSISAILLITIVKTIPKFPQDYTSGTFDARTNQISWITSALSCENADKITLSGDKSDHFAIDQVTYEITIKENLTETDFDENRNIFLIVIAESESGTADSIIVISLLASVSNGPTFMQNYYTGYYQLNSNDTADDIIITDTIELYGNDTDLMNIMVAVEGDYGQYFVLNSIDNDDGSKWTMELQQPLNYTILTMYIDLKLILTIYSVENNVTYDEGLLILKLPAIDFTESVYYGDYSVDSDGTPILDMEHVEMQNVDVHCIDMELSGDYTSYFRIVHYIDYKWAIVVESPLPQNILANNANLLIQLNALRQTDNTSLAASTTLVINLPTKYPEDFIQFNRLTYTGTYSKISGGTIDLETNITILNTNGLILTNVYFQDDIDYFQLIEIDRFSYTVTVYKTLPNDLLQSNISSILVTIIAEGDTDTSENINGTASLVINLPKNKTVNVEDISYNAVYYETAPLTITIPLLTDTPDVEIDISLSDVNPVYGCSSYFNTQYANRQITITASKLPEKILAETTMCVLEIIVKDRLSDDETKAILSVILKNGDVPDGHDVHEYTALDKGLLAGVISLGSLLVIVLVLAGVFWYFKLRKRNFTSPDNLNSTPTTTSTNRFTKNEPKIYSTPIVTAATRRATGINLITPATIKRDDDCSKQDKNVLFNDTIEEIDPVDDYEYPKVVNNYKNVSERRPTTFFPAKKPLTDNLSPEDEKKED